ncbi:MAG: PaaI family thioesterase [Archangium sp.]|nr:PaaI family thioesterase [Archangium sp.]
MTTVLELVGAARASGDWNLLTQGIPYMRFLGVTLERQGPRLLGRMSYAPHLIGNSSLPALHGGTLGALLESAAHVELLSRADCTVLPKTITLTVDYLRSGKPVDTFAHAEVVKQGRRVCTVHAKAWQDDEAAPIATATVQLLIR